MALAPKTASVFLIDCSESMKQPSTLVINGLKTVETGIGIARQYVKGKVVQRIMRELKTTPFCVILFGHPKTKNVLTTRAKEKAEENDEKFDRSQDAYRHCYELLPFTSSMDQTLLSRIDEAVAGEGPDGDAFTALILGIETMEAQSTVAKYPTKEIVILTDGESDIDWDGKEGVINQMNAKGMSLTLMYRINEAHWRDLADKLEQPSIVANARQAIVAISTPQLKSVNSRADRMTLKLGNPEAHPDSSLTMWVEVKKAVAPASAPTMKKMSMRGFERAQQAAQSQAHSQQAARGIKRPASPDPEEEHGGSSDEDDKDNLKRQARFAEKQNREQRAQMAAGQDVDMGKVGTTLDGLGLQPKAVPDADLATHAVQVERRYFYRPIEPVKEEAKAAVAKKDHGGDDSDEEDEAVRQVEEEEEPRERVVDDETPLTDAYHYGGSLVPTGDLEDDAGVLGGLQTGMEIVHFMKESDLRFDWRMNDLFYVYASPGQLGSEKLFSALVNGMGERKSVAVVRFVKKGYNSSKTGRMHMPDPQLGILYPQISEDGLLEYCYWARLPYAEDMRQLTFPSLNRRFNRKGQRLTEHKFLPTAEQSDAMDAFVDSMDLTAAGEPDEDGDPTEWFSVDSSFSPAIHNIQRTLVFRLSNPDATLPPPSHDLTKYMDPPAAVIEKSQRAREVAIEALDIKLVPPKPKKINKATAAYVHDNQRIDDAAALGLSSAHTNGGASPSQPSAANGGTSPAEPQQMDVDGDEDERKDSASPTVSPKKEKQDDDFVIVDAADAGAVGQEDEVEPDTDDEEPDTDDEA
ncbi:ATP-dependent DNA helicase yku80 [Rhodosporidiobolus nylandii]